MRLKTRKWHARRIANVRRVVFERLEDRRVLAVWSVSAEVPSDEVGSLEHALEVALTNNEDDSIQLDAGTYHLARNRATGFQVSEQEHELVLQGTGKDQTFLDAAGLSNRPFTVAQGSQLRLSELAVLNGRSAEFGGAVLNLGSFEASDVLFLGNKADGGGAIANIGIMRLEHTILMGNDASIYGGAVLNGLNYLDPGHSWYGLPNEQNPNTHATIVESAFLDNVVGQNGEFAGTEPGRYIGRGWGGGLHNWQQAELHDVVFTGNESNGSGGAIVNYGDLELLRGNISSNAARMGGGISSLDIVGVNPKTNVIDSLFSENRATIVGPDSFVKTPQALLEREIEFVFTENWQDGANALSSESVLPGLQSFGVNEDSQDNVLAVALPEGVTIAAVLPGRAGTQIHIGEGNGTILYTPASNSDLNDLLVVTLSDQSVMWVRIDVRQTNDPPVAMDDIYTAATWTPLYDGIGPFPVNRPTAFNMNVMANDMRGGDVFEVSNIVSFTQPTAGGQLKFRDRETPEQDDRWYYSTPNFLYSPPPDFSGTDSFTYVIDDGTGNRSEATVKVVISKAGSLMNFSLVLRDRDGKPVRQIREGDQVTAEVWVEISADDPQYSLGSADAVVFFPRNLLEPTGTVEIGDDFPMFRSGDVVPFTLRDEGNFVFTGHGGGSPDTIHKALLARVQLTAKGTGIATFKFRPELGIGNHVRGLGQRVPDDSISYEGMELVINRSLHNPTNPFDVNDDGETSPIDALQIINDLNASQDTTNSAEAEGADAGYLDVNNDGQITPIDALNVINHLNSIVAGGEGESAAFVSAWENTSVFDNSSSGRSTDKTPANCSTTRLDVRISQELFPSNGMSRVTDGSSEEEESRDSAGMVGHEELSDYINDDLLTAIALSRPLE